MLNCVENVGSHNTRTYDLIVSQKIRRSGYYGVQIWTPYRNAIDRLPEVHERLRNVHIEREDLDWQGSGGSKAGDDAPVHRAVNNVLRLLNDFPTDGIG